MENSGTETLFHHADMVVAFIGLDLALHCHVNADITGSKHELKG